MLLKNEFGDVEVDSQLAKESAVESVSEILSEWRRSSATVHLSPLKEATLTESSPARFYKMVACAACKCHAGVT